MTLARGPAGHHRDGASGSIATPSTLVAVPSAGCSSVMHGRIRRAASLSCDVFDADGPSSPIGDPRHGLSGVIRRSCVVVGVVACVGILCLTVVDVLAPRRDGILALAQVFAPYLFLGLLLFLPLALAARRAGRARCGCCC